MKFCDLAIGQNFSSYNEVGVKIGKRQVLWFFGEFAERERLISGNRSVSLIDDVQAEIIRIQNEMDGISEIDQQTEYDCSIEKWKDIPNLSPFQVSSLGNIRNVETGKYPNIRTDPAGYKVVSMFASSYLVHTLVALAFLGDRPQETDGRTYDVNHKDGDRGNSNINNLEYVTKSFNIKHSYKMNPYQTRNFKEKTNGK